MINILIADDHPIVRRGLSELINDETDMQVETEASSANETLEKMRLHRIDVILLDISMPGKSGIDAIGDLKVEFPDVPILVLSAMAEEIYAKRVIKNGASGFITKESAPEELINAIRKVNAGKKYVSTKLAELFAEDIAGSGLQSSHENLSSREFEVLRLIGNGKTVAEISKTLLLNVTTISTYRSRILKKLGLTNNSELIQYCITEKLI